MKKEEALENLKKYFPKCIKDGVPISPYAAFPDIPPFSVGWRMGSAEDYMIWYNEWIKSRTGSSWNFDTFSAEEDKSTGKE